VRIEALAESYVALERKLSARDAAPAAGDDAADPREAAPPGTPAIPDAYEIDTGHGLFEQDPGFDARLREVGFTQDQAQLVYDLAAEVLLPVASEVMDTGRASADEARLEQRFGGVEKWPEMRRQMRIWGQRNLPPEAFESLAASYDGVLALHRLMRADEPAVLRGADAGGDAPGEAALRRMIRDPRYWRDRDPAFIRRVADGFNRLYPGDA